jgi:Skp family chaperone for outer membrane proteins
MYRRLGVCAVVAAAACIVLSMAGTARAEPKVGVVDVMAIMDSYLFAKDARDAMRAELDALKKEYDPRFTKIADMKLKRDGFVKTTKEWKDRDELILSEESQVESGLAIARYKIDRKNREILLEIYRQVTLVVGRLAKEQKLDMVFTTGFLVPTETGDAGDVPSLDDLKRRIQAQSLVYPTPTADLTMDAIKILNDEYKASKGSATVPPVPTTPGRVLPPATTPGKALPPPTTPGRVPPMTPNKG